mmetsp:Transcript_12284/g.29245  ORF Transcript_12284/g.29245 Transcript_12284/m.29245 type:complete len:264 (+) Transcript_12284:232-1023(+)|eukprot:CAMPEP_0113646526 /NCGR_PEP_ID=MMETSP0017_2-20120614/24583_1 /TAXON_ID=2856 /ORGANISM="Cylindrotheca closterium" /LENGTH=263 /DNA_ID=CAMNT_0000558439 /DNA_START=219 /DNA_END=1010 /DNA_ORIENTATION=- /assembly_acc=CAM_ASM_000147
MSAILEFFSQAYHNFQEHKQTEEYQSLHTTAHTIVFYTVVLTVLLELWSLPTVRLLLQKQPNGRELYAKALFWNIFNQYGLGIPLYPSVAILMTRNDDLEWNHLSAVASNLFEVVYIWIVHAIGYYYVHKAFHLSPKWYKYHKFHHRFNAYVPPTAANAVEAGEYVLAYLLPFVVALAIWPLSQMIHRDNLTLATSVISVLNLLVHTPKLEGKYMSSTMNWTRWFVSTEDHLNHHRKLKCHYASPTFNVDNMIDSLSGPWKNK